MYFEIFLLFCLVAYYFHVNKSKKPSGKPPPGPYCLPIVGYLPFLGKVPSLTITRMAKKYGNIFKLKLGKSQVVFLNDYESIKEAMKIEAFQGRNQLELFEPRGVYGLGLLEGKDWVEVKRFTLKCLRDMGFGKRSMEGLIQEQVIDMCHLLKKNAGQPLYMKPLVELSIINGLWLLLTSEKFDIEDPEKRHVNEVLAEGIADQNILGIAAFLPWLAKLAPVMTGYSKGLEYLGAPEKLARDIIDKHVNTYSPDHTRDFIDAWLTKSYSTTDPTSMFYKEVGMRNLHYTLLDLFFAGSDTLSSTLGWSFLYLAYYPEVQEKVLAEIDEVIGKRLPTLEDRTRMPYSEATMSEVLRKSSMVPLGLMHSALEDVHFNGYLIPKRTVLMGNLYGVHHDPQHWGDPENFRPERFIKNNVFKKDDHLIPFFIGKRSCPGEALAVTEYFLFFIGILQNFSFTLDPNSPVPDLSPRSGFILPPPKHLLIAKQRSTSALL